MGQVYQSFADKMLVRGKAKTLVITALMRTLPTTARFVP